MLFIPVSYSNALIVSMISATAADVRTSPPHWNAVFLYVHRVRRRPTAGLMDVRTSKPRRNAAFLYVHRRKCLFLAVCTDVRTTPPHWIAGFLYVHRVESCEKAH